MLLAMGLNVVVGLAGLLDLGYAAFFAIGAYTYAYSNSPFSGQDLPFFPMLFVGAVGRRDLRHRPWRADAAPARRLPRDHDARLRRDRADRVRELGSVHAGHERHLAASTGRRRCRSSASSRPLDAVQLHDRDAGHRHHRDDAAVPAARFPDRAGLDGDPRGRAGGLGERHQHGRDQAARVRDRRHDVRFRGRASTPRS